MAQEQKVSDEFIEYLISSGKTKMNADMVFEDFKNLGYYQRCIDSVDNSMKAVLSRWNDEHWKIYIYNYAKLTIGIKAITDKSLAKIIA